MFNFVQCELYALLNTFIPERISLLVFNPLFCFFFSCSFVLIALTYVYNVLLRAKNPCSRPLGMFVFCFPFVQHSLNVALILNMYVCFAADAVVVFIRKAITAAQLSLKPLTAWMLAE